MLPAEERCASAAQALAEHKQHKNSPGDTVLRLVQVGVHIPLLPSYAVGWVRHDQTRSSLGS